MPPEEPKARPRVPRGLRPQNLETKENEQLLYMLLALTAEFSTLNDRLEDLARYLNADGDALEKFLAANPRTEADRTAASERRKALFDSLFRILREDLADGPEDEAWQTYQAIMERAAAEDDAAD